MATVSKKPIKNKKTKRKKAYKGTLFSTAAKGGHLYEDEPHYHLIVKMPYGQTFELGELFAYSSKSKYLKSATVSDLKQAIIDRQWGSSRFMKPGTNQPREFTLFWRNKALLDPNAKIRRIVADNKKLKQYVPNNNEPIMLVFDDDLEYPGIVETNYDTDTDTNSE